MELLLETLIKNDRIDEIDWKKVAASAALGVAAATSSPSISQATKPPIHQEAFDRKVLYDVVWAESGHSEEEVKATASVYLNRIKMHGPTKAFKGSSAHNKSSIQYKKASSLDFDDYERSFYEKQKRWIDELLNDPSKVMPYDYHENVRSYGNPSWANSMKSHRDIGKQRFYTSYELANSK